MYYGPIELRTVEQVPFVTVNYDIDLRVCYRIPVIATIRSQNDNDEPYITKVDKLLCILDDIIREGGDEVEEVKDILNKLCKPR